jgi:xanthine dehydrogenase accessory factor
MRPDHLAVINDARRARRAVILLTDLESGKGEVIAEGKSAGHSLQAEIDQAFRTGKSVAVETGDGRSFINVLVPPPRIVVIGAVHISQALASMAPVAGFDLSIIDPRTAFATSERFDGVDLERDWPEDVLKRRPLDAYCALVAVTHQPEIDDFAIVEALRAGCFYVGALGSRKTHARRIERMQQAGISDQQIARIDAPIGLDIGAQSPAEIAVAVLGSIIQAFRRRDISR